MESGSDAASPLTWTHLSRIDSEWLLKRSRDGADEDELRTYVEKRVDVAALSAVGCPAAAAAAAAALRPPLGLLGRDDAGALLRGVGVAESVAREAAARGVDGTALAEASEAALADLLPLSPEQTLRLREARARPGAADYYCGGGTAARGRVDCVLDLLCGVLAWAAADGEADARVLSTAWGLVWETHAGSMRAALPVAASRGLLARLSARHATHAPPFSTAALSAAQRDGLAALVEARYHAAYDLYLHAFTETTLVALSAKPPSVRGPPQPRPLWQAAPLAQHEEAREAKAELQRVREQECLVLETEKRQRRVRAQVSDVRAGVRAAEHDGLGELESAVEALGAAAAAAADMRRTE